MLYRAGGSARDEPVRSSAHRHPGDRGLRGDRLRGQLEDIELYGRSKRAWLETFLALPNGIPSHDTFRRVFMLIDPSSSAAA